MRTTVCALLYHWDGMGVIGRRTRMHRAKVALTLAACLPLAAAAQSSADAPALDWEQARQRLEQVSDALAAADAAVRNKQDLQDATRLLRLPEITGEVRRLQFQKTLTLPLGSLAPVAEAFGIDSPLSFTERDWRTRPVVTAVLPLYTGGVIPAAQRAASAAHEQASAEREAQRQSLTVQLAQAYFGQRLAEQAVDVRRDVRDGLNRHLSDAEKLEREGFATRAQRLQATVARDKAEREYQKTVNDLATLKAALATLLRSGGEVQPVSPLFVQRVPLEPVASFERTAQARQPQIARLRAMVAQAEQGVRVQQAKLKPQIFAFGQYDFRRRDEMLTDPDWAFGIGLKYTFLSPNSRPAQISAARAAGPGRSGPARGREPGRAGRAQGLERTGNRAPAVRAARQQHCPGTGKPAPAGAGVPRGPGHLAGCDRRAARPGRRPCRARTGRLPIRYCAGTVAGGQWTDGPF